MLLNRYIACRYYLSFYLFNTKYVKIPNFQQTSLLLSNIGDNRQRPYFPLAYFRRKDIVKPFTEGTFCNHYINNHLGT